MCDKAERRLAARTDGHVKRKRNTNMGLGVHQGKNVAEMRAAVLTRRRCGFDTRLPHQHRGRFILPASGTCLGSGTASPPRGMTPTLPLHHLFGAGGPLARGGLVRHRRSKRAYFMGPKKGPGETAEARTKGNRTLVLYHEKTEKSNQGRKDKWA